MSSVLASTVDPDWATVEAKARNAPGQLQGAVVVVLHRVGRMWRVKVLGTSGIGCALPRNVRADLHLETGGCPPK